MHYFINQDSKGNILPSQGTIKCLIKDGAKIVSSDFQYNLVCVVETMGIESAVFIHDQAEMDYFKSPCGRKKTWLVYSHAKRLSGYGKGKEN